MMPLKIAVFHPRFDKVGGAELFIVKIAAELRRLGHQVDVFGVRVNPIFKEVKQLGNFSSGNIFYNATIGFLVVHLLGFYFLRILKKEKYDIINPHHYPTPFISVLLKKLGFTRAKIVWMCHGLNELYYKDRSHWGISEFGGKLIYNLLSFFRWIDGWSIKNVDTVVSNSRNTQAQVKETYQRDSYIVNPAVDLNIFNPSVVDAHSYITSRKCLLAVGRLRTRKNFDFLIRVLKEIIDISPDVVLRIVGEGPEKENLIQLICNLDLREYIELLPTVGQEDLAKIYKACDLFVHPVEKYESWGMVILEAMAMGKPVVAINSAGPKEIIIDGQTGYLANFSPDQFTEKIVDLLNSPQKASKMGEEGRKRVLGNFSWEKSAQKMEEIFYKTGKRK